MARSAVSFKMKGTKSLEKAFLELADEMESNEVRDLLEGEMMEAAQPMVTDARAKVRRRSGRTANTIHVSPFLQNYSSMLDHTRKGFARVFLGTTHPSLGVIIEFGTVLRKWTGSAARSRARRKLPPGAPRGAVRGTPFAPKSTGVMPAFPFLRPAWEAGHQPWLTAYGKRLWAVIEARANRIGAKQIKAMEAEK